MKLEILDVSKDEAIWASDFQTYNPRWLEWVRNCYDFILVTNPTVDISFPATKVEERVHVLSLGQISFQHVTGGVYKIRERIHRHIAD